MRAAGPLLALHFAACASQAPRAHAPAATPARVVVRATLTMEGGGGGPPPGVTTTLPEPSLEVLVRALDAPASRDAALASAGRPPSAELAVRADAPTGRMAELSVTAATTREATALCEAWVREGTARATRAEGSLPAHLAAEKARISRALAATARSLSLLPRSNPLRGTREQALTAALVARLEAREDRAALQIALGRMLAHEAAQGRAALERGLGEAHPERAATAARIAVLEKELARQRTVELAACDAAAARLRALPRGASEPVTASALADWLEAQDPLAVSSLEPTLLQDRALARWELLARIAELSVSRGEAHPERQALEGRLREEERALAADRKSLAALLRHEGRPAPDGREQELAAEAKSLAVLLARIEDWEASHRPARVVIVAPCHGDP